MGPYPGRWHCDLDPCEMHDSLEHNNYVVLRAFQNLVQMNEKYARYEIEAKRNQNMLIYVYNITLVIT